MADFETKTICGGAEIVSVFADRFKTNEISVSFFLPLSKETAAVNALVVMLLSRSSEEYPDMLTLNKKLASLYGAQINASVSKTGELQQLKIDISSLDGKFALDNEDIASECVEMLLSMIFKPKLDAGGIFPHENIEREKRVLIEKIESEENEKRVYVLRKTEEAMFKGEPYSVNKYGTKIDVEKITAQSAYNAWRNILKKAKIVLTVVGNTNAPEAADMLREKLSEIERDYTCLPKAVFIPKAEKTQTLTERIDVKQGKLVMGFRVDAEPGNQKIAAAMRSFADIFGGGPYSKLFANVREKMSLCYYCSARYDRRKSFLMIQSGCEEENMDKACSEILNQLEEIKKGNFDYEFSSSKIALTDTLNSVYDTPENLEAWYSAQGADDIYKSPEESAAENDSVTKELVVECANKLTLDTVYKLVSLKEDK
ncbi:MAG: insulinase family protein [Clostridiales bacterium]|nr:insulinase family protein [Clostridiales bacterium]